MVRRKQDEQRAGELTPLEEAVMSVVWKLGECNSAEVIAQYNEDHTPLAPTTVRTVLAKLRDKGCLTPVPTTERGFRLRATISRNDFAGNALRKIARRLLDGGPKQAVTCLLNSNDIDEADLDAIQALIEERKRHGGKG